jgi:hypothetical protein
VSVSDLLALEGDNDAHRRRDTLGGGRHSGDSGVHLDVVGEGDEIANDLR